MSDDLRSAVEYARWWTNAALDLAANTEGVHAGVVGHLTAAQSQHWAVEQLMKEDACPLP